MSGFGKRNINPITGKPRTAANQEISESVIARRDAYEEPFFVRMAIETPWPLILAVLIPLCIFASTVFGGEVSASSYLYIAPGMALLGVLLYFCLKSIQKGFASEREEREFQSKHSVFVIAGMFAGLIYFMISKNMGFTEIIALDWSNAIGGFSRIGDDEPLTHTLFSYVAAGGAVPFVIFQLINRFSGEK